MPPDPAPDPDPLQAARATAARLAGCSWGDATLPADADVPSLLHHDEKALLYSLAREHVDGSGIVVDLGPLVGGSTAPLAAGLRDRADAVGPATRVRSYDLLIADRVATEVYADLLGELTVGEDLRPRFEANLAPSLRRLVDLHRGDLLGFEHDGAPIEVLFVDVAKSWELNDHLTLEFFPHLVPGHGVVIQQDWVHEWLPWLHITMELLADHFAWVGTVPWASAVWVCTRPIVRGDIPRSLRRELADDRKLALFDRAMARVNGDQRGVLEVARATLLKELGDLPGANAQLRAAAAAHPGAFAVEHAVAAVRASLRDTAPARG